MFSLIENKTLTILTPIFFGIGPIRHSARSTQRSTTFGIRPVVRHFHRSAFRPSAFRHGPHKDNAAIGLVQMKQTLHQKWSNCVRVARYLRPNFTAKPVRKRHLNCAVNSIAIAVNCNA